MKRGWPGPSHFFVSGRRAPQLANTRDTTYDLRDAEFIEELRRLRGTPAEVLENTELLHLVMPLLRADFTITQTFEYQEGSPLTCSITAVGGLKDEQVAREHLAPWREVTTGDFSLHMVPGDHFFLHTSQDMLLEILARHLARLGDGGA